jgi:hypothetical protein
MLESVKVKQRFKSVSKVAAFRADKQDLGSKERNFLKAARENPSGIYHSKNRDLLP